MPELQPSEMLGLRWDGLYEHLDSIVAPVVKPMAIAMIYGFVLNLLEVYEKNVVILITSGDILGAGASMYILVMLVMTGITVLQLMQTSG